MAETTDEKPQESQSGNISLQQPSQNDIASSYNPSGEVKMEENIETEEKRREIENRFNEFLKAINEETTQLGQFLIEEKKLINELCGLLTPILTRLKVSFTIPSTFIKSFEGARQITLDSKGHLIIARDNEKVESKFLAEYPSDIVLAVFCVIIPELEKAMKTYRRNVTKRVSLLEKIKYELKNLHEAVLPVEKSDGQLQKEEPQKPLITSESSKPATSNI